MKVNDFTKDVLKERRFIKEVGNLGYIEIKENGDPIGRMRRGDLIGKKIKDVIISPSRLRVFIRFL